MSAFYGVTAAEVRERSRVDFASLGWPEPLSGDPDLLQEAVDAAASQIQEITGRTILGADPGLALRLRRAVRMWVEYDAVSSSADQIEALADFESVQSFTAGDVSETRRSTTQVGLGLHPWPALARELGSLVTPERATALGFGSDAPAVVQPDYDRDSGAMVMGTRPRTYDPYDMRPGGIVWW